MLTGAIAAFAQSALAAELTVEGLALRPGSTGELVVSGSISGESTYGVTIMMELVPRPGAVGRVDFTPGIVAAAVTARRPIYPEGRLTPDEPSDVLTESESDIRPLRSPWPRRGSCTVYDTHHSGSLRLNGLVMDNGNFVATPINFNGTLGLFPIAAERGAHGIWDIRLTTSRGASSWEGVQTDLHAGTLVVTLKACVDATDCDDENSCTEDSCSAGECRHEPRPGKCKEAGELEAPSSMRKSTGSEPAAKEGERRAPRGGNE